MELSIDNFRCFKEQNLRFSKINILIGENSSGKSSILKFFLVLKQSLLNYQNMSSRNLTLQGDYTDLGNYKEMIHLHDINNNLNFSFKIGAEYPEFFRQFLIEDTGSSKNEDQIHLMAVYELLKGSITNISITLNNDLKKHSEVKLIITNDKIGKLEIIPISETKTELDKVINVENYCTLIYTDSKGKENVFEKIVFEKEAFFSIVVGRSLVERFEKKTTIEFFKIASLLIIQNYISDFIEKLQFINPLNSEPKRFFFKTDPSNKYFNISLDEVVNLLTDDTVDNKVNEKMISDLNSAIKFLGVANEIKLNKNVSIPVTELVANINGIWNNISDVGYGTALQIPILFQILLSNSNNGGENILIEQPEIHLHPKLHAQFIETILKFGNKNTYFIETHSEHIIRKLQVIVKNKLYGISASDISIHYFQRNNECNSVSFHEILDNGKLNPALPSGFFDNSYLLTKELLF